MSCQIIIIIRNHPAANPDPRCHGGHPYVDEIIRQEGPEASHLLIHTSTRQLIRRYLLEFVAYHQSSRGRDSAKSIERTEPLCLPRPSCPRPRGPCRTHPAGPGPDRGRLVRRGRTGPDCGPLHCTETAVIILARGAPAYLPYWLALYGDLQSLMRV